MPKLSWEPIFSILVLDDRLNLVARGSVPTCSFCLTFGAVASTESPVSAPRAPERPHGQEFLR